MGDIFKKDTKFGGKCGLFHRYTGNTLKGYLNSDAIFEDQESTFVAIVIFGFKNLWKSLQVINLLLKQ